MIKNIIAMLQLDDFYNESENIQISKGFIFYAYRHKRNLEG
jgi:hypothetical protein